MKAYLVKNDGIDVNVELLNVDEIRGATVIKNSRSVAQTGAGYRIYADFAVAKDRAIESLIDTIENLREQLLKSQERLNQLRAINEGDLKEKRSFFV
jgi:hypothetical protein